MSIEYPCVHFDKGKCKKFSDDKVISWCVEGPCVEQMLSNADRIRAMVDEELAKEILWWSLEYEPWCDYHCKMDGHDDDCNRCIRRWLQQPAEGE